MSPRTGSSRAQLAALIAIVAICGGVVAVAATFPSRAKIYPMTVALVLVVLGIVEIVRLLAGRSAVTSDADLPGDVRRAARYVAWIVAYFGGAAVAGLVPASAILVGLFLIKEGGIRWTRALGAGIGVLLALLGIGAALSLQWPPNLLSGITGL